MTKKLIKSLIGLGKWYFQKMTNPIKVKLKRRLPKLIFLRTSVSDRKSYAEICTLASKNDAVFKNFKRHKDYQRVLEHVTQKQGQAYLNVIKSENKNLLKHISKFQENDQLGNPLTFSYKINKKNTTLSPTTLRYVKVLSDLKNIFSTLNNFEIIEIGGGYGGQGKIISSVFKFKSYTMVDLVTVLPLARKYLRMLKVKNVFFLKPSKIPAKKIYDLVISNYAFSECGKEIQNEYIDKVLKTTKKGYITYNYQNESKNKYHPVSPYSKKEIIRILSKYHQLKILPERPKTGSANFIIVWDDIGKLK
ncbi:putative sugar O-methyltransferase [Candidatus Beckwithbacteria bacterium CG10_big_fil_rev_8_21_14_0_10_34_10]|uniref:Putative sugar O-methyltransferase n=1 Tax=Candidatus Beckwithbacteria bacterium CG10_big_fil_rev_8_21_14_0_10_34_10 TaxID=1974495 RepID=A0A2H0W9L0_9BACT|nr:MAG: putative sugar O-methyltransferase [Candidatus Beckwithbacteria bacterium CG10_big_fil_rev_8_21_14_0_10_34_10]